MTIKEFLEYPLFDLAGYTLTPIKLLLPILILVGARVLVYVLSRVLRRFFRRREVDEGRSYAVLQFVKYILYILAILLALQAVGIEFSLLIGGAAALLVGIGLGLQQTFNDWFSGIILLVEGAVEVGDMIMLGEEVAIVKSIGIRTSKVESRDQTVIIIPNSKLVADNVVNWSNNHKPNRFHIDVGVAYGSDVRLVEKLLLQAAREHKSTLKRPAAAVQFTNFGDSSLDFRLLFFSNEFFRTEFMKSDIRFRIVELFAEHNVEIPFPQRDVWMRK
ncbi:MAG: mechanosensitive ion channel domain-containing protein [Bacteroidota bacterium]